MFSPPSIFLAFCLLVCGQLVSAATVNSTYLGQCLPETYNNPACWSPPEVPNNTADKNYDVSIAAGTGVAVDIDAVISNLNLAGWLSVADKSFVVLGTTNYQPGGDYYADIAISGVQAPGFFNAGTLASSGVLRGSVSLFNEGQSATLQLNADITSVAAGTLWLYGAEARLVDQHGNDALSHLARLESGAQITLTGHAFTTSVPFTNFGTITIGDFLVEGSFTALAGLTNFDPSSRTLTDGSFIIGRDDGYGYYSDTVVTEFRFAGADVVTIASNVTLGGPGARFTDLNGNDGLRNLARNDASGTLSLLHHDFTTAGSFTNDGSLTLTGSVLAITGALNNFNAATRTLSGGAYSIFSGSVLKFSGADIVHNQASIHLSVSKLTDLEGSDGLRNFTDNQTNGSFTVGKGQLFVAPGNFTNSGRVEIIHSQPGIHEPTWNSGELQLPAGSAYTQTAGETVNDGIFTAPDINVLGGSFSGIGSIKGNLTISNATVAPGGTIDGNLKLSADSVVHSMVGQYGYVDQWRQITGSASLAGRLEVELAGSLLPNGSGVFVLLQSNEPITGTFSNAPSGVPIATSDGGGSFFITYESNRVTLSVFQPSISPAQLLNISTRVAVSRADDDPYSDRAVLIGGFIISGTEAKKVVVRGLGPSLANAGVNPTLSDPTLELHAPDGSIIANDNWRDTQESDLAMTGLAPGDNREAAALATLDPGSYTVVIREKNGLAGTGLFEVYDISGSSNSKLANMSTRGFTDGANVLIGGIIAGGPGEADGLLVVRALGPQLRSSGIVNALDDPTLELRDANGFVISSNDDWTTNSQEIPGALAPHFSRESALRILLPRGNYTAIVRPKANGAGGVALVEFYDLRN